MTSKYESSGQGKITTKQKSHRKLVGILIFCGVR